MTRDEEDVLRQVIATGDIELGSIRNRNGHRLISRLVGLGYVEERDREVQAGVRHGGKRMITFYRATEQGHAAFYPLHKKLWYWFSGDIRTIVVAVIVAIITTLITLFIQSFV